MAKITLDSILYANRKQINELKEEITTLRSSLNDVLNRFDPLFSKIEKDYSVLLSEKDLTINKLEGKIKDLEATIGANHFMRSTKEEQGFQESLSKFDKLFSEIIKSIRLYYEGTGTYTYADKLLEFVYNLFVNKPIQMSSIPYDLRNTCSEIQNNYEQSSNTFAKIMSFTNQEMKDIIINPQKGEIYNPSKHEYKNPRGFSYNRQQSYVISDVITLGYHINSKIIKAEVIIKPATTSIVQNSSSNVRANSGWPKGDTMTPNTYPSSFNANECGSDKSSDPICSNNGREKADYVKPNTNMSSIETNNSSTGYKPFEPIGSNNNREEE